MTLARASLRAFDTQMARTFAPIAIAMLAAGAVAQDPTEAALRAWFAKPTGERGTAPTTAVPVSRDDLAAWTPKLLTAWRDGARALGRETLVAANSEQPGSLQVGTFTMPYVLRSKGDKPANGWALFLCLHGGGGNGDAKGPHAWDVNTREWQAQQTLQQRIYPSPGLYFIPRMADDRQGRWWFDHNQAAFDDVIRQCLLFRDVDPDRVYLLGISEGGYGAIRFAANRPDRFAACNGMAAAEPLDTSPPANMRNVALRIDIGERDTMFDRIGLAQRMGEELGTLRAADPDGYDFVVDVQKGRGHGIDYRPGPQWLTTKVRQPWPQRLVWSVRAFHTTVAQQHHWLALDAVPATLPLHLTATLRDNQLVVTAEHDGLDGKGRVPATDGVLRVRLNDTLVDLARDVSITVNGVARPAVRAQRSLAVLATTLAERDDPRFAFPAEITIELGAR